MTLPATEESERVFSTHGLGYSLTLPEIRTELQADQLRRSGGAIYGDLTVRSRWPGARGYGSDNIVISGQFNFSSPTTRKSMAALLDVRVPAAAGEKLDWHGFIEEFCQQVMAAEKAGEPFVLVGNRPTRLRTESLVVPLLPHNKVSILYGDGGVGKSYFAVATGVAVASGMEIIPGFRPTRKGGVLYLDYETDDEDLDWRIHQVCDGADIDPVEFTYRFCTRPIQDIVESVARVAVQAGIELVIVDSVGAAMGGGREGGDPADTANRFFDALRLLKTTVLLIDHVPKVQLAAGPMKPYGSTYKVNRARCTWEMRQATSIGDGSIHVALFHRKSNDGPLTGARGLAVKFEPGGVYWQEEEIRDEELASSLSLADRLEIVLREKAPASAKELATAVGSTENTVRSILSRNPARFESVARGSWTLVEVGA